MQPTFDFETAMSFALGAIPDQTQGLTRFEVEVARTFDWHQSLLRERSNLAPPDPGRA